MSASTFGDQGAEADDPDEAQAGHVAQTENTRAFTAFLDDLSINGCAALADRLTGPVPLSRLCVKHLRWTENDDISVQQLADAIAQVFAVEQGLVQARGPRTQITLLGA
jgi:hypothetical protein